MRDITIGKSRKLVNIVNYSIGLHTGPILSTNVFKDDLNERERERKRGTVRGEKTEMEKKEGSRRQSKKEGDDGRIQRHLGRRRKNCLLYTSPSPRDGLLSRMPSSA